MAPSRIEVLRRTADMRMGTPKGTFLTESTSDFPMRRLFALAVLLVHALLLLWVVSGMRPDLKQDAPVPAYAIQWIPLTEPVALKPVRVVRSRNSVSQSSVNSIPLINEPPQTSPEPLETSSTRTPVTTAASGPKVDWTQEGVLAAQRAAERSADDKQKTFSPLPKIAPQRCEPKESSMEWNGEEDRRVTWVGPMPVFRIGNCIVTLGAFACGMGGPSEANSHLLDDMRKPDRARSSVPDPHICD